jgi:general secretion pathway protein G
MRPRGFTLIELLVVIAIIGLLSSVVLASLSQARSKSRDSRRIADLNQIRNALELYYHNFGDYPDCLYSGNHSAGTACGTLLEGSGYIASIPKDPSTNLQYSYAHTSPGNCAAISSSRKYHLGAALENHSNAALSSDADSTRSDVANGGRCFTTTGYDFFGLAAVSGGQICGYTDGTAGTETCYDLVP